MLSKFCFGFRFVYIFLISIIVILLLFYKCYHGEIKKERAQLSEDLSWLESKFREDSQDGGIRLKFARTLFELGDFEESKEIVEPLLKNEQPSIEALKLMAYLEYSFGDFVRAEELIREVLRRAGNDLGLRVEAEVGLVFIYYQTLQYEKAANLFKGLEGKITLPQWEQMKSFKQEKPYRIEWRGEKQTEVPFLLTDPLPIVSVEIQGKKIYVIIDTGGEAFYLDSEFADSLGIKTVAKIKDKGFAGGKETEGGYAKADSLKIGSVTLKSVPVVLTSIRRFSKILTNDKYPISGVLSTGELRQFLSTIDYPGGKLVLRPKTEEGRLSLQEDLEGKNITKIPFALGATHFMVAKAKVNDRYILNLLFDSGLADSEASVAFPIQTLNYLGIPVPDTEMVPESLGGPGGGGFPVGRFTVDKLEIGFLVQKDTKGVYGVFPSEVYWASEFIIDGIVSHNFLKKYSWTIDFSRMEMIFAH